ncbi:MAG: type II toxin-antitoxin system VapC family toxin [Anaerosomatales bacterium]|nr:type II toxin-antitoxin system VapC family toxin [Anaerosomatales bacterium]
MAVGSPRSVAHAQYAARIAAKTRLTVYDAAYVALALRLDAPLVTCDAKIIAADACSTRPLGQAMR